MDGHATLASSGSASGEVAREASPSGRIARAKGSLALTSPISSASRHRCATRISLGLVMSWLTMFPRLGTVMIHHAI